MKRHFLLAIIFSSVSGFASTEQLAGKYIGSLSSGEVCSVNIQPDKNIIGAGTENGDYVNLSVTRNELQNLIDIGNSPLVFEGNVSYAKAKVKLYISKSLELEKMKIKISYFPSTYKVCRNFIKVVNE